MQSVHVNITEDTAIIKERKNENDKDADAHPERTRSSYKHRAWNDSLRTQDSAAFP